MAAAATAAEPERTGEEKRVIDLFKAYLRVKTVSSLKNYGPAVELLRRWASDVDLAFDEFDIVPDRPIVTITWAGSEPKLPSVVLNSHMDVVPAEDDKWDHDPWAATEVDGKIYGRGTQDMKSVGVQYMEAVQRLKERGYAPRRTIVLLFVPDEEHGGQEGMALYAKHPRLAELNAGVVLDEGLASPTDEYTVFYGERKIWWVRVRATGAAGHGSRFVEGTAVPRLIEVANRLLAFREEQYEALKKGCDCGKALGDFTSVNLTSLIAGVPGAGGMHAYNVIPTEAEAGFDVRIPATMDLAKFKAQLDEWTAGEGVSYDLVAGTDKDALHNPVTELTEDNQWWQVFKGAAEGLGLKFNTQIFPAATDSRFLRALNIPAFGFSPMVRTPILLHDHNEHIPVDVFLHGVTVYEGIIPKLADAVLTPAGDVGFGPSSSAAAGTGAAAAGAAAGAGSE